MVFLIASDSHGDSDALCQAYRIQPRRPDGLIFLGDGLRDLYEFHLSYPEVPILAVKGNCDFYRALPDDTPAQLTETRTFDSVRIFMTHGHAYGVKGGIEHLVSVAFSENAGVALYGHTHIQEEHWETEEDELGSRRLLVCNPGSIGYGGQFATLTIQNGVPMIGLGKLSL